MRARLTEQLIPHEVEMLQDLGELAADLGMRLFLAGGSVRDIILGRPHEDWDLTLEGDGPTYARALADKWHGKPIVHERFLTATVRFSDHTHFDIATTRREEYPGPGALPVVEPAPIEDDLWRRDFSINAMAVALSPDEWGVILDPTEGKDDLDARLVRALHDRSFWDDATRIIRGIGFEQRLGFRIEPCTEQWVREAAQGGAFDTVSTERLGEAILPLLRNSVGPQTLKRANELGVARAMGARAAFTRRALNALDEVPEALKRLNARGDASRRAYACLAALMLGHGVTADAIIDRLHLDRLSAREMRSAERFLDDWPEGFRPGTRLGDLWGQLREANFSAVAALWLSSEEPYARDALVTYWCQLRKARPDFDASELRDIARRPGPIFGDALQAAVMAKLNQEASGEEQLAIARSILEQAGQEVD